MTDFFDDQNHDRERKNCPEGEPGVNPDHHCYGSAINQYSIDRTHNAKAGQHADVSQIIGKAGDDIPAAAAGKITEVKPGQALEQVIADAKFNNSGSIQDKSSGKNTGDAVQDRQD